MTRMRCTVCGRMVPLDNFTNAIEARCFCGKMVFDKPGKPKKQRAFLPPDPKEKEKPLTQGPACSIIVEDDDHCTS